ncbi:hypothetical protein AB3S75_015437 [Citrus x aurantiifolia]
MGRGDRKQKRCLDDVAIQQDGNIGVTTVGSSNQSYGFMSYFKEQVKRLKASDENLIVSQELRKKLGDSYKSLPPDEKVKYTKPLNVSNYDAQTDTDGQLQTKMDKQILDTRCAPDRFSDLVQAFNVEKQRAIREIGFGNLLHLRTGRLRRQLCAWLVEQFVPDRHVLVLNNQHIKLNAKTFSDIMGVHDGGLSVSLSGQPENIATLRETFKCTGRGIAIKTLEDFIKQSDGSGNDFKVAFMLFALATVLCPSSATLISASFLHPLVDTNAIKEHNWASFCYSRLVMAISKFKSNESAHLGGCLLFLQIFYFESVENYYNNQWGSSLPPVLAWNDEEIKKIMRWLKKHGGDNYEKVRMRTFEGVGLSAQVPVDMAELVERITEQSESIQFLTTSFNRLNSLVLDLVTAVKQSFTQKADSESKPIHHAPVKENIVSPPTVNPKTNDENQTIDDFFRDTVHPPLDLHNDLGDMISEDRNPIEVETFLNDDVVLSADGAPNEANVETNMEALNTDKSMHAPIADNLDGNITRYMKQPVFSSTSRSPYEFRSLKKPSRFQRSPFDMVSNRSVRPCYWAGPYVVTSPITESQLQVVNYLFDESLDENQLLVSTEHNVVSRTAMSSLKPTKWIHSDVISMYAEYRTMEELRNNPVGPRVWFLPVYFSNSILHSTYVNLAPFRKGSSWANQFMPNMETCEKIFVPIHDGSSHWFVLVINIHSRSAQIWDSQVSSRRKHKITQSCLAVLKALDHVLGEEGQNFRFTQFQLGQNSNLPQQSNGNDCGLYVMRYMDESPAVVDHTYKHDSDKERLTIALYLALSEMNPIRNMIIELASDYYSRKMAEMSNKPPPTGNIKSNRDATKLKINNQKNSSKPKPKGHGKRR